MSDLPWSEDYMLRMSHPMYDAFCREDEGEEEWLPCRDDYEDDDDRRREERDAEERNNLMKGNE